MLSTLTPKRAWLLRAWAKPVLFVIYLLPLTWLVFAAFTNGLGSNPAEALIRATGDWTLRCLCLVLAVTPLRVLGKTPQLARFRRMMGVFTFFYASVHLSAYSWLDMGLDFDDIAADIVKRPFILVGFLTWLIFLALAATSFNRAIRWLGAPRWQLLHKTVYATAFLGVLHFFWMRAGKNNFAEVYVYAAVLGLLLGWRVWQFWRKKSASRAV